MYPVKILRGMSPPQVKPVKIFGGGARASPYGPFMNYKYCVN